MAWPLTWVVVAATLPGVAIGGALRVLYLPDPKAFKLFAGLVLLYIGLRLAYDLTGRAAAAKAGQRKRRRKIPPHGAPGQSGRIRRRPGQDP